MVKFVIKRFKNNFVITLLYIVTAKLNSSWSDNVIS